jgi:hypothetical protein
MDNCKYIDKFEAINVKHVANVIPLRITCDFEGKEHVVMAYINYETQEVHFDDLPFKVEKDELDKLGCDVLTFLTKRSLKYQYKAPEVPESSEPIQEEEILDPIIKKEE